MASTYKTPGVYVEEVSTFPPSVAPVETAIPAFIGYTAKATKNGESILNVPTKVNSFVEFSQYFGGAPDKNVIIRLNGQNQFVSTEIQSGTKQYYLYDSLRLFYDNGGGDCYIVSVGNYLNSPEIGMAAPIQTGILGGLKALEKYDEPTLIVSPDATLLDGGDMYSFQQQALSQCARLQDRFFIGDLLKNNESVNGETFDDRVIQVRDKIGINDLKYGALYTPWLKASLSAGLKFSDVLFADVNTGIGNVNVATSRGVLFGMTQDQAIRNIITDVEAATSISSSLEAMIDPNDGANILDGATTLEGTLKNLNDEVSSYLAIFTEADGYGGVDTNGKLTSLYNKIVSILASIESVNVGLSASGSTGDFKLKGDIQNILSDVTAAFTSLATHHQQTDTLSANALSLMASGSDFDDAVSLLGITAANPAAVPQNDDTLNEYYTQAAVNALIAYINTDLPVAAGVVAATTGQETFGAIEAELPVNLADEVSTNLASFLALLPANQAALDGSINGSGMSEVGKKVAVAYSTEQTSNLVPIANVNPNVLNRVNTYLTNTSASAHTANQAGGNKAAVLAAIVITPTPIIDNVSIAAMGAQGAISKIVGFFNDTLEAVQSYESTFNASLKNVFGTYKTLLSRAEQDIMVLPPSAAIAGIYTKVDNDRGVWKAPANISLSSVSGPFVNLNAKDQEGLNVDVNAGKSINAIRSFTGKGVLVWGARTLAGNDNEWRYVPVRRFYNFAEESIKKATEPFVFEPNDANTWVRIRAMIENFLTLQWRAGALAGAKPDHAFFVKVGLGETMTANDILEGRMIVEIGMAVVRPAEFIILRFSHKMQES